MNYPQLSRELKNMEENPGTVRFLDLRKYSKQLDAALEYEEITQQQYDHLNERFMKI